MSTEPAVIYVRDESPNLLGRAIVQGFGFGLGFLAADFVFWILAIALLTAVLHQQFPAVPKF